MIKQTKVFIESKHCSFKFFKMDNRTVIVLAPNGRRQTVKLSPNSTVLQIIDEVCKKQGLNSEKYDVMHHNKCLDTTTIIRFSGLPNNAQLELIETDKVRLDGIVTLGIQLENGTRLLDSFSPNASIWEVLMKLCPDEANLTTNLVVIYMRREMYGRTLLEETTLRSLGLTNGRAMFRLVHRTPEELQQQANISTPLPTKPTEEKPYVRTFKKIDTPLDTSTKLSSKSSSNNQFQSVEENKLNNEPKINNDNCSYKRNDNFITEFIKREKQKQGENSVVKNSIKPASEPEKENTVFEEDFVFLGARNAMVFSQETTVSVPSEDLPDEFFDLTISDAKKLLKDLKNRQFEFENSPLQTSALRNLEKSKQQLSQLNKYKQSIIRVNFPDQTVLQGTFSPIDTIGEVLEFVKEYLENNRTDCYLYTAPPKQILAVDSRLIEIGCVPNAVLHFGTISLNKQETYLKKSLVGKFTTASIASLAAAKMRQRSTRQVIAEEDDDDDESDIFMSDDVNVGASTSSGMPSCENYSPKMFSSEDNKISKRFKPSN